MLKRMLKHTLVLAGMLAISTLVQAQTKWQEGVHYKVVADKASETPQVREVFSFWCPHCFTFEPLVGQLKTALPDGVTFTKAHADFLRSASPEAQDDATRGMLAAKAMKQGDLYNKAVFDAIHKDRKQITGMADIKAIFAAAGGDAEKLEKLSKSFGITGQVRKNDELARGVQSVPTFFVNEKYQPIFTREMTPDQWVELVNWLTTQK